MYTEDVSNVLRVLADCIDQKGVAMTLKLLQNNVTEKTELSDYANKVFSEVEKHMGITREDILKSRYMHGDTKYAVGLCVYFMSEKKTLGAIKREVFPNKTKTLLSTYSRIISKLNPKSKVDKRPYDIREKIKSSL